jgi:asparagine synthase (glutamine-hydrolysing)
MRWETMTGATLAAAVDLLQRHAAHAGLEIAFPFLDWDLVSFVLAVPPEHWPAAGWLVRFHREALRRDLPPEVYQRRSKAEFTPAVVNRVRCGLPAIQDLCAGNRWESGRFIAQLDARRLAEELANAPRPSFVTAYQLWAVASLEAWLRRVLDYPTPQSRGD